MQLEGQPWHSLGIGNRNIFLLCQQRSTWLFNLWHLNPCVHLVVSSSGAPSASPQDDTSNWNGGFANWYECTWQHLEMPREQICPSNHLNSGWHLLAQCRQRLWMPLVVEQGVYRACFDVDQKKRMFALRIGRGIVLWMELSSLSNVCNALGNLHFYAAFS